MGEGTSQRKENTVKRFYVDLVRGQKIALLAGPFRAEEVARKYEKAAYNKALDLDCWAAFDLVGVVAIDNGQFKAGILNDRIEIDPADLMQEEKV